MSDKLLSGNNSSGWDETLLSENPFDLEGSASPESWKQSGSKISSLSKHNENGRKLNKQQSSKNKQIKQSKQESSFFDSNLNNNQNPNETTNQTTKNNKNSNNFDNDTNDLLDLFAPTTTMGDNNITNTNDDNDNDNPFLTFGFDNNNTDNNTDNNTNNNNDKNNINNINNSNNSSNIAGASPFDFFNEDPTQRLYSPQLPKKKNNNNIQHSRQNTHEPTSLNQFNKQRKSQENIINDEKSETDTSTDSDYDSDDSYNNNNNNAMIAPPSKRSSRHVPSNNKRHSAPHSDIETVTKQLSKEPQSSIAKTEHNNNNNINIDPRSPGVGTKIRSEKDESKTQSKTLKVSKKDASSLHDVLPELKRGTALLKYGRHGYPHFRQFNLSEDHSILRWFSSKKKLNQSEIKIVDIHDVITGQHTNQFNRIKWTTLTPASFSIIYGNNGRSLNLVAKSVDEMKMWVEALRYLRTQAKKGTELKYLRKVEVSVDFKDRNRPQSRQHSGNFLRSHETKEKEINSELQRKLIKDLESLRQLVNDIGNETNNPVIQESSEYKSIAQILSELEERIGELDKEVRNTRNTKIAENDVWRTKIDLESLREKVRVLYKSGKSKHKNKDSRRWSVF